MFLPNQGDLLRLQHGSLHHKTQPVCFNGAPSSKHHSWRLSPGHCSGFTLHLSTANIPCSLDLVPFSESPQIYPTRVQCQVGTHYSSLDSQRRTWEFSGLDASGDDGPVQNVGTIPFGVVVVLWERTDLYNYWIGKTCRYLSLHQHKGLIDQSVPHLDISTCKKINWSWNVQMLIYVSTPLIEALKILVHQWLDFSPQLLREFLRCSKI